MTKTITRVLLPLLFTMMLLGGCTTNQGTPPTPPPGQTTKNVTLYYPDEQFENMVSVSVPLEETTDSEGLATIQALIKGTALPEKSSNPFPEDLKINQMVSKDGSVTIDFNDSLKKIQGSAGERAALNSLLKTLSQFPEYKTLTLKINGDKVDTLGHYDLTNPLPIDQLL